MAGSAIIQISGNALAAGLSTAFFDTLRRDYSTLETAALSTVMRFAVPTQLRVQPHAYWENAPHPERQPRGQGVSIEPFANKSFDIPNHAWAKGVKWHADDREDDQTQGLESQARQTGENFVLLNHRIFYQILLGSTNTKLLPTVPNAPDGVAFFSALDGDSNDRFGISGGNILGGGGVGSGAAVRTDFWKLQNRVRNFLGTKGQPFYEGNDLMKWTIFYNSTNDEVFREAFRQGRTVEILQNVANSENVAAAAVTNTILEGGLQITLVPTTRITDDDWYGFFTGRDYKPVIEQVRSPLKEKIFTEENDREAADVQEEFIRWRKRSGYGLGLPINAAKVNN